MRNTKNSKGMNKLPAGAPGHKSLFQKKTLDQTKHSSSVPDTTHCISNVNTGQRSGGLSQPINDQEACDSTQCTDNDMVNDS